MIELRTLGTLSLLGPDGSELQTVLVQPKRVALLTYLAVVSRMGLVRRDPLLGLFWPEHDEARARASLRQALYEFRQELGQEVLVTRGDDEVGLNSELFWCDVSAFEAALGAGDLELAVSLYRGSFLAGFSLRGSVEFDQWMEVERDRLARAYAGALERLAEAAGERGDTQQAAEWWRRLVEHDPYATRGVLRLMEALESAGDRAGALEQADRHAARMLAEMDAEPSPDVVAFAERLRRQPVEREKPQIQPRDDQKAADLADRLGVALADRYSIERELGSGGMATVYLAEDVRHHRKVAVKVLRPELAAALGPDRFHCEIEIAAQLTHPNVLTLIDSGDADGFLYYVMPYIEGQSLREKLAREGELPIGEAVRILRDVVDALDHAHKHGVVHRDIKPDNVMLSGRHALVTDFGVAKAVSEATGAQKLTTEGVALGTPAYMSPEQAAADKHIDHRADIYAVGAVAYELLTGRPPFTGTTPQEVLSAQVTQAPDPVTKYRATVSPALAQVVMKCLEKKAADRWQSAEELLPQLEALATLSGGITPTETSPVAALSVLTHRARITWAAVVVAAAALAAMLILLIPERGVTLVPNRIVVTPFRNLTGADSLDVVGEMAAHWLTQGLQRVETVDVVPADVAIGASTFVSESEELRGSNPITAVAEELRAGVVVSGVFLLEDDSLRFQAEITDASEQRLLGSVGPISGLADEATETLESLRQRVMGFLAASFGEFHRRLSVETARPPTFEAFKLFVEAVEHHERAENAEAIRKFYRAFELDTTFLAPLALVAVTHYNSGEYSKTDSLFHVLQPRLDELTPWYRLHVQAIHAVIHGEWEQALRFWREQADLAPASIAPYNAAYAARFVNRPREAIGWLRSVDPEREPLRGWFAYWSVLTACYHSLGEHEQELIEAQRSRELYAHRLILALNREVSALAALGRVEEVRAVVAEAVRELSVGTTTPGVVMRNAAAELRWHGHADAAREVLDRADTWYRTRPSAETETRGYRWDFANTLYRAGRWDEARQLAEGLVAEFPDNVEYGGLLGWVAANQGDRETAERQAQWLADPSQEEAMGWQTLWRAAIVSALGDPHQAVALLIEASGHGLGYGDWVHTMVPFMQSLREHPSIRELMRPKG